MYDNLTASRISAERDAEPRGQRAGCAARTGNDPTISAEAGSGGNAPGAVPATYNNLPILETRVVHHAAEPCDAVYFAAGRADRRDEGLGADDARRVVRARRERANPRTVSSTTNAVTTFPDEEYFAWTGANVTGASTRTAR